MLGEILEKMRLKGIIGEWDIILNLMGQIDKFLHSNILLHVFSSYKHTLPLFFHESLNGHPLSSLTCHVAQC
jgi:hypothetical protein